MISISYITTQGLICSRKLERHSVMEHVHVSVDEIMKFYSENNIEDYPKTKKGLPNMSCSMNKKTKVRIMKQKILEKNKKENKDSYTTSKEEYYRNEILSMSDEELSELSELTETCAICMETMSEDYCILKCEHMFCVNCIANYCQTNNKCPLCRESFCDIINKRNNQINYDVNDFDSLIYSTEDIVESVLNEGLHYNGCNDSDYGEDNDTETDNKKNFEDFLESEMEYIKLLMKLSSKNKDLKYTFNDYIDNVANNMKKNLDILLNETIFQTEETISTILRMN